VTLRPNIVLITSDQQRGDCFGFEGRRVRTPHLDDLARAGTRFAACITPNLVCQPSRASILTGLLPLTHGPGSGGRRGRLRRAARAGGLPDRVARQGPLRYLPHVRSHGHAGMPAEHGPLRARLARPLHGVRLRGACGGGPQLVAAARAALGPALRALVPRRRPRRGAHPPVLDPHAARPRRAPDVALCAPPGLAQLHLGRGPVGMA
jgi:hypothetical protein